MTARASTTQTVGRHDERSARRFDRFYFELLFASQLDPWNYESAYEQRKYAETLAFMRGLRCERALEVGCAEGRFTQRLAPLVEQLVAADISQVALDRARARCAALRNVSFARLDLIADELPGKFDLILCCEVLYYLGGRAELTAAARKLVDALEPGGFLLTANANVLADDPASAGYDWALPFGARTIGEVLGRTEPLRLVQAFLAPLYRLHLFERPPAS